VCSNGRSIKGAEVEQRVLAAIKDRLLAPERVALAVEEARLAAAQQSLAMALAQSKAEAELAEVKRRSERLVDQVAEGIIAGVAVRDKLVALEARRAELESELTASPEPEI